MKKKIGLLILLGLILISCKVQKKTISDKSNCEAMIVPASYDLALSYKNFESDSDFYKNQLTCFDTIQDGILLYRWQEQFPSGDFLIIDFDQGFNASKKRENFTREVNFSLEEKKNLKSITGTLKKESYYQRCLIERSHALMYVLVIRHNNEKIVQYYSPLFSPYEIKTSDENVKSILEIFRIMDHNYNNYK